MVVLHSDSFVELNGPILMVTARTGITPFLKTGSVCFLERSVLQYFSVPSRTDPTIRPFFWSRFPGSAWSWWS